MKMIMMMLKEVKEEKGNRRGEVARVGGCHRPRVAGMEERSDSSKREKREGH